MNKFIHRITTADQIAEIARRLRGTSRATPLGPARTLELLERWSVLLGDGADSHVPGAVFLRLWLRRGTLEPLLTRELGREFLTNAWRRDGAAATRCYPLGLVGHWPAANIEIQPLLSMTCALLAGNACLVRVPDGLVPATAQLLAPLWTSEALAPLAAWVAFLSFDHARDDLQAAMARAVDGAMIWGGAEAITHLRALPFAPWARIATFGPRLSVGAMDASAWKDPAARHAWCVRIARDVWQFDQQACTSPQTLFLERTANADPASFVTELRQAFAEENRQHPRRAIEPALTSSICLTRANWLLADETHDAAFPATPDWTILLGTGLDFPPPTQGRTLTILLVDDLREAVARFDGSVQTLGLAMADEACERDLAERAAGRGVDRIVKLGRMHVFGSPWDGVELIRPMTRLVRHVPSQS